MECRTKDELEQHLSDIRRLATSLALRSEEKDAAARAEPGARLILPSEQVSPSCRRTNASVVEP
jgi:hypothetical protein